ncbi:MAG TPA: nucleotide sugar dehydrogenase [Candidatus Saccharimonadales bacterium]
MAVENAAVVGLGYVGLPLAVKASSKYKVYGIDVNAVTIKNINERKTPFPNDERLKRNLLNTKKEQLIATADYDVVKKAQVVLICVPTPTTNNVPDLSFVLNAVKQVALRLQRGQIVAIESTVYPGVTRKHVIPLLEEVSKLKCGVDFYVAHCPERIDPGNPKLHIGNINRVIGGATEQCGLAAAKFYKSIINADIVMLESLEEAEFVKAWENSYRNATIALANQAAVICDAMNIDIGNVTRGLKSKIDQFGLELARPGIGPGGHCIPEDIYYVIKRARYYGVDTRLLDDVMELNEKMPSYAVHLLQQLMAKGGVGMQQARIALLGLAYKGNTRDARRSPAIEVAHILMRKSRELVVHDPFVAMTEVKLGSAQIATNLEEAIKNTDAVFIATDHKEYIRKVTPKLLQSHSIRFVLDGRNCLAKDDFLKAGIHYKGVGQ